MKQLVILSGKGGTGKTSVAAAFAHLLSLDNAPFRAVLADADVDASNLELVLSPKVISHEDFWGGQFAKINEDTCTECGICEEVCRFDAISSPVPSEKGYQVDPIACDGCAACVYQCPVEAITMHNQIAGEWFQSESRYGPLFHASLGAAQENSGKLVTLVKQQARLLAMDKDYDLVLVDGPPGIGCPVISAVSGADLALIVAEPTASGVHDMHRVLETTAHFGVPAMVCINKADIYPKGTSEIENFCHQEGISVVGKIPFDTTVTKAMVQGQPVTLYASDAPSSQALRDIWAKTVSKLKDTNDE
ncbi:MAG: (4Fe-4S)-binding protein [Anaerolineaceae bacterium 4572_5.1]|nr:MAG: (4Fe-4S)-binding protein [Anaerolineaceae bacterium 4572_5.1]